MPELECFEVTFVPDELAPLEPVLVLTTDDPPEDDELSEIIELGRRADFTSGNVPTNELRNLGAEIISIKF